MRMNSAGLKLLKTFEGWRSAAYRDPAGIWTIGYGHTAMAGPPGVRPGQTLSRAEGEQVLKRDLAKFAASIRPLIQVPLNDNQFSALLSFSYNVGVGNFKSSSVLAYVNQERFSEVPARLLLWCKAGGRELRGLSRRRAAEGALFLKAPDRLASAAELDQAQKARRQVAPRTGKSVLKSTTNRAAAGLTLAVVFDQVRQALDLLDRTAGLTGQFPSMPDTGIPGGWAGVVWPATLSVVALGVCALIITERRRKSAEDGI